MHYFPPVLLLTLVVSIADAATSAPATYAGVSGAAVLDSGAFVVVGGGPFDREENFEMIQRADGGHTVVNTVTAKSGSYRVQGRFDWDADWNAQSADGIGFHDGKAVSIAMRRAGKQVNIDVAPLNGPGKPKSAVTASFGSRSAIFPASVRSKARSYVTLKLLWKPEPTRLSNTGLTFSFTTSAPSLKLSPEGSNESDRS